jgi:branched-chain amino acid transport system permease protein
VLEAALRRATAHPSALRTLLPWLLAVTVALLLPQVLHSGFVLSLLCRMGIAIVFALSFNMLLGQGGMLDFGHAIFSGLGGFAAMHAMRLADAGWLLPIPALPLAGAVGGLLAALLAGSIATRRSGTAFAMITLGLAELTVAVVVMLPGVFGGEEGVSADRSGGPPLFGLDFGRQIQIYYVIALWALACAVLMALFTRTPLGRLANAARDNAERVDFLGYDPARVRFLCFVVAGMFAGVAGGLQGLNDEIMTVSNVGSDASGAVLLMTYIGGVGIFWGPVLGAVLVTLLQMALGTLTDAWALYSGLIFVVMVLWAPGGIAGIILAHAPILRAGLGGRLRAAYLRVLPGAVLTLAGVIALAEMGYRAQVARGGGHASRLFGLVVDPLRPLDWVLPALLFALGVLALRRTAPAAHEAWQEAAAAAQRGLVS